MLTPNEPAGVVTAGPWVTRDGFVAETSVKLDRVQAKAERADRSTQELRARVEELAETIAQAGRFQAFEESLRNAREYKLDELVRGLKELKGRINEIEGPRTSYAGLTHRTFEQVDRKLHELQRFQERMQAVERAVARNTALFGGALLLLVAAVMVRFM